VTDEEEREGRTEDLFEDLDKFFAPIQDVDWPEEGEGAAAPEAEAPASRVEAPPATTPPAEEPPPKEPPAEEPLAEPPGAAAEGDDLLGDEWADGLGAGAIDVDLDVPPAGEEPATPAGEPTAQMSTADWEEVRAEGAAPAGTEEESFSFMEQFLPDEQTEEEVPEFGYEPEPGAASLEGEPPITIDDLRRAPEAYRDLPTGDEAPGAAVSVPEAEEEPAPETVEAAAEHFAESIREEEPDLGVGPTRDADLEDLFGRGADEEAPAVPDLYGEPGGGLPAGDEAVPAWADEEVREPYSDRPEPLILPGDEDMLEDVGPRTVKVGTEDAIGPSWQEPTSVDVPSEGEIEPAPPQRNLPAAILTGLALAVVAVVALLVSKAVFAVVAGAVVLLAQLELYTAVRKRGYQPAVPLGIAIGGLVLAGGYLKGEGAMLAMLAVGVLFTPLWYMATPAKHRRHVVANIGVTLLGLVWVPFLAAYALVILHDTSRAFLVVVLALAVGYDVASFAIGTLTGNKPLAPSISPNKTREGAYGGFLVIAVFAIAVIPSIDPIRNTWQAIGLMAVSGLAALFGDLSESLLKRDLGVKDMGTIFPGHGGALDRIDSILFVAPVAFYFLRIFVA
jgi:phosphatidate cytidylyltransferase